MMRENVAKKKPARKAPIRAAKQNKAEKSNVQRIECTIPPRVSDEVLNRFTLGRNEDEADRIAEYVEWQCAKDNERTKAADFIAWSTLIADSVSAGSSAAEIRGYLKSLARSTWQLVSWLTHAANAVRYDGTLAVDATYAVLNAFGAAIMRHERPTSDRCSRCASLRIQIVTRSDSDSGEAVACESCGFVEVSTGPS